MAETVTMNRASVAKPISRRRSAKPVTVSASAQAQQLQPDLHRQARSEGVIQRQGDGFPLDQSRVANLRCLRHERRQSPRSEADVGFYRAKSERIRLRVGGSGRPHG